MAGVITEAGLTRGPGTSRGWRRGAHRRSATTPGSSSPPARPARPRVWRSPTATPRRSSTPRRGCSCSTTRSGPDDRVLAGLSVGVRRLLRGDVAGLAARRLPGAGTALAGAQRHGPRAVAGRPRHHRGVDRAHPGGAVAGRGTRGGAAADLRRGGLPAGSGRAPRGGGPARCGTPTGPPRPPWWPAGPGSPAAHRSASGCRCRAGIWRWSTPTGAPVALGERRRTGDRRGGPGPLPRSGEGRREVRADADAGLAARLPQRGPGAAGTRRAVFPGPRRRPGEGRRAAHRTRRGRLRPGAPARGQRRCGGGAQNRQRHTDSGRLHRLRRPDLRPCEPPAPTSPSSLPAALVPRLVLVDELPTRTSGKVDRDALPWPPPGDVPDVGAQLGGTMGWLAALWQDVLGTVVDGPEADFFALGGGSLSAAQLVVALRAALSRDDRRPPLRPPAAGVAGRVPRRDGRRRSRPPVAVAPRHVAPDRRVGTRAAQVRADAAAGRP